MSLSRQWSSARWPRAESSLPVHSLSPGIRLDPQGHTPNRVTREPSSRRRSGMPCPPCRQKALWHYLTCRPGSGTPFLLRAGSCRSHNSYPLSRTGRRIGRSGKYNPLLELCPAGRRTAGLRCLEHRLPRRSMLPGIGRGRSRSFQK